ncbi:MAG: efflux transporter outer membrane subunit [Nitrospira sp.]|nr:efflux transporter outer membrane subunit [Nitrospira sp.]
MNYVALKMLFGDRAKYLMLLCGLTFAVMLIVQQGSIFWGLMMWSQANISNLNVPIWVTDPGIAQVDEVKPIASTGVDRVRSVDGVEWAVPLYKGLLRARLADGDYHQITLTGLESATLIGRPAQILEGRFEDILQPDAVVLDQWAVERMGGPTVVKIGTIFELNDKLARVVAIAKTQKSFTNIPVVYTTYERAMRYVPRERRTLSYVLAKAKDGVPVEDVVQRIRTQTGLGPGTTFDLWNSAMDLRWELDFWGRIRRGREAAQAETKAIEEDARAVALSLISDVGQSYFRIRELDEQFDIASRTHAVRQESLEIIQKRAAVGLASELDVKRTEVLVAEAAGLIPDLTRLRAIESHRLEVLTGMAPGSLDLARKPLRAVIAQPNIPVGLPSQLLERRPDILQVEATLVASNARIGQARAYFFPTLMITGQGGLQSADFAKWFTGNSFNYSIGPSVTLPIFQGGTNLARLDHAESQYQQLLENYRQTILLAFREVADLLVSLHTRGQQLTHQRAQLTAAQEAVRLAQVRYRNGMVTYLDVLDAQRIVLTAETQLVLTERARLTEMVSLFKALGGGWTPSRPVPAS